MPYVYVEVAVPIFKSLTLRSHYNKHDTDVTPGLSLVVNAVVYKSALSICF